MSFTHSNIADDSNPNIIYTGSGWVAENFDAGNVTKLPVMPLYNTLHSLRPGTSGEIQFTFNGSEQSHLVMNLQNDQATFCVPGVGLSNGTHILNISVSNSSTVLFDFITYAASEGTSVGDVLYYSDDPSVKVSPPVPFRDSADFPPGRSVDIDFVGYSLSAYALYAVFDLQTPESTASYAVDDGTPINFTISNPIAIQDHFQGPQLLLQTPNYQHGKHHFHLDFFGTDETVPFTFLQVVVQNTADTKIKLAPLPSTPLSALPSSKTSPLATSGVSPALTIPTVSSTGESGPAPSSLTSAEHPGNRLALLIGAPIGAIALLIVILCLFFYGRQRLTIDLRIDATYVRPFIIPRILQIGPVKLRSGNIQTEDSGSSKPSNQVSAGERAQQESVNASRSLERPRRVIVHVDMEDQPDPSDPQEEIEELPPAYLSIGYSRGSR
ncbi:hypothetical protein CVT26_002580 [Gymnopilus dilepis]|uniref:Uncharacterized protein n=1 Tax=Gymnopilus dilepis TaxID=231916 RepID=A0A409VF36_9AGAR|nr:hypothetical protein CVT26_002580 [Gymnopilus dilepis]